MQVETELRIRNRRHYCGESWVGTGRGYRRGWFRFVLSFRSRSGRTRPASAGPCSGAGSST